MKFSDWLPLKPLSAGAVLVDYEVSDEFELPGSMSINPPLTATSAS